MHPSATTGVWPACAVSASVGAMYEHKPERIHFPLLLLVVGAHAALLAYTLQPARLSLPRDENRPRRAALQAPVSDDPRRPQAAVPTSSAADDAADTDSIEVGSDPRRDFSPNQWHDNQIAAQAQRLRAAHADLAALMQAQPEAALQRLQERLRRNDAVAAQATQALQQECETPLPPLGALTAQLEQAGRSSAETLRALAQAQQELIAARKRRCDAWDKAQPQLAQALQEYRPLDAVAAQLQQLQREFDQTPPPPSLFERLLAELRALWQANSGENVPLGLAGQLLAAPDPGRRELGLQLLEQVAENNDRYAALVANFLRSSDGQQLAAAREPAWTERAAALGDDAARDAALTRPHRPDAAVQDWSWHAYGVWFAAQGCRPPEAGLERLQRDLAALQRLDQQLSPAQREQASTQYRERIAAWGERARRLHGCAR